MRVAAASVRQPTWTYCGDENCAECSVMKIAGLPPTPLVPRIPLRLRVRRWFRR